MSYTYKQAINDIVNILKINDENSKTISGTNGRGIDFKQDGVECVIFICPIGCKKNNRQNWIDTRDSGVRERKIAKKYALKNNLKYFCLCINSEQEKYKDYIFSLENTEEKISSVSYRSKEGKSGTGTQANIPNNFSPSKDFERICTDKGFYFAVIHKSNLLQYLKLFDNRPYENKNVTFDKTESNIFAGYNKIYYGIPGCGKSYHIEHKVLENVDKERNVFRTTFYLDYSNSDFIGQIYPIVEKDEENNKEKITYKAIPGPFTKALARAYENLNNKDEETTMIYLVIEEINRGNAAAIFGDLFQLLDRLDKNYDGRVEGDSEYPINNEFIESFLKEHNIALPYGQNKIFIPHNLTILATMNTSDQNVFPLDTAFKRRWDRERIVTDWESVDSKLKDMYIPFTNYTWEKFATTVNKKMISNSDEGIVLEDKQLGPYFINKDVLVEKSNIKNANDKDKRKLKKFVNNVIDYLYSDVTKFEHSLLFKNDYMSYDEVYDAIIKFNENNEFCGDYDLTLNVFDDKGVENHSGESDSEED